MIQRFGHSAPRRLTQERSRSARLTGQPSSQVHGRSAPQQVQHRSPRSADSVACEAKRSESGYSASSSAAEPESSDLWQLAAAVDPSVTASTPYGSSPRSTQQMYRSKLHKPSRQKRSQHATSTIEDSDSESDEGVSAFGSAFDPLKATTLARMAKRQPTPLEEAIKETETLAELQALYMAQPQKDLAASERVTFCHQLARLSEPTKQQTKSGLQQAAFQAFLEKILVALRPHMPGVNTYESVTLLHAIAKLRYSPSVEWLGSYFECSLPLLKSCGPGNLTVLIRSVARLKLDPLEIKSASHFRQWIQQFLAVSGRRMDMFRGDQLMHVICSLAELHYRPDREWTSVFCQAVQSKIDVLDPSALTKGMLAMTTLQCKADTAFMKSYHSQLYSKLPMFDDRDMATTVQAMSTLRRLVEQDFMLEFYPEVIRKLPTFSSRSLSNLLLALGSIVSNTPHKRYGANKAFSRHKFRERVMSARLEPQAGMNLGMNSMQSPASGQRSQAQSQAPWVSAPSAEWTQTVGDHVCAAMVWSNASYLADSMWGLSCLGYKPKARDIDQLVSMSFKNLHTIRSEQLIRMINALGAFGYTPESPAAMQMYEQWGIKLSKIASRRPHNTVEVCDLIHALGQLPCRPPALTNPDFIDRILEYTRVYNLQKTSPTRLSMLVNGLKLMDHQPSFGFLHNYCQAVRHVWQAFKPQEYADMLEAIAAFNCPVTADPLWASDFMATVLCKMEAFDAPSLACLLRGSTQLPGLQPSAQWLAAAIYRVEELLPEFTGPQMGDIILALGKIGYRPPALVLDAFVHHLSMKIHELPPERTNAIAEALSVIVPSYLTLGDGHQEYHALQMKLRVEQMPSAVLLRPVPKNGGSSGSSAATCTSSSTSGGEGREDSSAAPTPSASVPDTSNSLEQGNSPGARVPAKSKEAMAASMLASGSL